MRFPFFNRKPTLPEKFNVGHVYVDVYHHNFYLLWPTEGNVVTDNEIKEFIQSLPGENSYEVDGKPFAARAVSYYHSEGGLLILVALRDPWGSTPMEIARLGHEVFHATEMLMDDVGIQYHIDYTGEAWAYLTECLMYEFLLRLEQKHQS